MEIKDNMEHLSLSQSKSNMKQFNKQLQAVPREMIEWLGLRGHVGWLWTVRCGIFFFKPGHLACAWQLCMSEKLYAFKIRTMGRLKGT